MLIKKRRKPNI
ncbi:hypothetical protein E2C01_097794 [Portunus trituberculatus]|uniref:Uncharacterized protein n=1 Tax=Portunus trituberculatus TaxID=210409 RepID=A0A5B7K5R7_PORTR|nr:hypothetical protein [Portunus trituberculatus]